MGTSSKISLVCATNPDGKSVARRPAQHIEKQSDDISDAEDWFANACKHLFPQGKAGTELWAVTDVDERSCQRYAAGHVKPPAYFLRSLLRSKQGWTWLRVVMDGSDAEWWTDHLVAVECANAFNARRRALEK